MTSPFFCILYLPLILASLRYGVLSGILLSTVAGADLFGHRFERPGVFRVRSRAVPDFPLAGLFGAVLQTRLRGSFREVAERVAELDASSMSHGCWKRRLTWTRRSVSS